MSPLLLALALIAQPADAPAPAEPPAAAAAAEDRWPAGAPRGDYPFVAWCYGALRGWLELRTEVMPEVTRIENTFRRPGTRLEDDLATYAAMEVDGRRQLKVFEAAMTAAEKASPRPLNAAGAAAVRQGRNVWTAGPDVTPARKAQEWMSWAVPALCETTAVSLEQRAALMGPAFRDDAPVQGAAPMP